MLTTISVVCVYTIIKFEINSWPAGSSIAGIIIGISLPKTAESFVDFRDNSNWKTSQRKLLRGKLITNETLIRISFAYLYRIKINGKYFLIKNERGTGKFQPVGGVFKFNGEEAEFLREKFHAEDDDKIPVDESSKRDYRLRIKNKYLRLFVKRFTKTKNRETIDQLCREFKEELFDNNYLNIDKFGDLSYNYSGRHFTDLQYSQHFGCYELLMADIVNIKLNSRQEKMFKDLISNDNKSGVMIASTSEIKSLGLKTGSNQLKEVIADHTQKILMENNDKLAQPPKYEYKIGANFNCKYNIVNN